VDRAQGRTGRQGKVDLESQEGDPNLEPLRTQAFQLNYTKAEDIAGTGSRQAAVGPGADCKCAHPECPGQRDCESRAPTSCS
jgi:hypothetical protein